MLPSLPSLTVTTSTGLYVPEVKLATTSTPLEEEEGEKGREGRLGGGAGVGQGDGGEEEKG